MADTDYARLRPGVLGIAALVLPKPKRGGKRPGAGRPRKNAPPKDRAAPPTKHCECGQPVAKGRSVYCDQCGRRERALKRRRCEHAKPLLANGKERKVCYDCAPRPEPKPRKPYTPKLAQPAVCRCGKPFVQGLKRQRYCSSQCRIDAANDAAAEARKQVLPRACAHCGETYKPQRGNRWKHYCSANCRRLARNLMVGGNTHRRRARKFGCDYQPVNKRKVFERDGWRCYLCGCETPQEMRGKGEPNSPELDHVVPLAAGGAHSYENVRCACRRCNLAKGAKTINADAFEAPAGS